MNTVTTTHEAVKPHMKTPAGFAKLDPLAKADVVQSMLGEYNQTQLAEKFDVSKAYISNLTIMYHLPEDVRKAIKDGIINASTAVKVKYKNRNLDDNELSNIFKEIIESMGDGKNGLSAAILRQENKYNTRMELKSAMKRARSAKVDNTEKKFTRYTIHTLLMQLDNGELSQNDILKVIGLK